MWKQEKQKREVWTFMKMSKSSANNHGKDGVPAVLSNVFDALQRVIGYGISSQ